MCRMCEWRGEGTYWYLNPKNYGHRMYKKRPSGARAAAAYGDGSSGEEGILEDTRRIAEARANGDIETANRLIREVNEQEAKVEGAQVVPLEDALKAMDIIQGPLGAMMCWCRKQFRGDEERSPSDFSCLGIGAGMLKWDRWPERYRGGVEFLSPKQAKEWVEYWDKRGYVHLMMTYAGFIGGLCNCDYPACYPIRLRLDYDLTTQLVKSEYVAKVDLKRCNGCGDCIRKCQFRALNFEVARDKANINPWLCFGCGVCRVACPRGAIGLVPRQAVPALANVW